MSTVPTANSRIMPREMVSFEHSRCGTIGYPSFRTTVAKYVQWIHNPVSYKCTINQILHSHFLLVSMLH